MAELCLDCLNNIMNTNDPASKYILTWKKELCEECGEYKRVIIRMKYRYIAKEMFCEAIHNLRKLR